MRNALKPYLLSALAAATVGVGAAAVPDLLAPERLDRVNVSAERVEYRGKAALRLVEAQYQAGAVTITRYLETEVARTDARSHAIAARYDARRAEAGLRKAVGLWAEGNPQ